jgi:hypothetical protein
MIVTGNRFEVVGTSKLAVYEHGKPYYFLSAGDRFDMAKRAKIIADQ